MRCSHVLYSDVRGSVTHVLKCFLSMLCVCRVRANLKFPLLKNRKIQLEFLRRHIYFYKALSAQYV